MLDVEDLNQSYLSLGEKEVFFSSEEEKIKTLLKHLNLLKDKAKAQHPTKELEKLKRYYTGDFSKENTNSKVRVMKNQYNVIKGIVDTISDLILDSEIVSTVVTKIKSFASMQELLHQQEIADILQDINKHVLNDNNFDVVKSEIVLNMLTQKVGIAETVWEQNEGELGEIRINSIDPLNFYPDTSAKKIQDCNYIFIKESYSPITLKKKYPQYAKKFKYSPAQEYSTKSYEGKDPTGVVTTKADESVSQSYTYGSENLGEEKQKNVIVWKCYLKDDSTFIDKEGSDEEKLKFIYPNGRLIVFVEGAKDYILEDKPIDYPFGFPIDIFNNTTGAIFGNCIVEYLLEIQDRINKAFWRIQYLVGAYLSALVTDGRMGLNKQDIINQTFWVVDQYNPSYYGVITNNTLSEIQSLLSYIDKLESYAYKLARVNPSLINGERQKGVTSGAQIVALNESPMSAIREYQRHFRNFIISQGKKNIVLSQLFYNTQRIIRLSKDKEFAKIPDRVQEDPMLQQGNIEVYRLSKTPEGEDIFELVKEIQGDLSIGEYDIDVIAGSQLPRSRSEKAQITQWLFERGIIPPNSRGVDELLTSLDFPNKNAIIEELQRNEQAAQAQAMQQPQTPPMPPVKEISVAFKDMPPEAQIEMLQRDYGLMLKPPV